MERHWNSPHKSPLAEQVRNACQRIIRFSFLFLQGNATALFLKNFNREQKKSSQSLKIEYYKKMFPVNSQIPRLCTSSSIQGLLIAQFTWYSSAFWRILISFTNYQGGISESKIRTERI